MINRVIDRLTNRLAKMTSPSTAGAWILASAGVIAAEVNSIPSIVALILILLISAGRM